jgi:stage V sporulation protein G
VTVDITEVRIKLVTANNDKLRAFCSITIDHDFVVRDLKIIEGAKGPFVAMPSRKLTQRCSRCGIKNPHRARYCNDCGSRLPQRKQALDPDQRLKLHADIAHPINSRCREALQRQVLEEYANELERSKAPDYQPAEIDGFDDEADYFDVDGASSRFSQSGERWNPARYSQAPQDVPRIRSEEARSERSERWGVERSTSGWRSDESAPRLRAGADGFSDRSASEGTGTERPVAERGEGARRGAQRPGDDEAREERDGPAGGVPQRGGYFARDKIPSPRAPIDDSDLEPEDNFGEGLFS